MSAYFDTNTFDHLYKKIGCTAADIANLRKRIYGRDLAIFLSIHTLEEILLDRRARPELMVAKTKLTLSLGNFRRMVKPCDQLLADDIRAYAQGGEAARPFIDATLQNIISEGIAALVESDGEELDDEMIAELERAQQRRRWFGHLLKGTGEAGESREEVGFNEYCVRESPRVLEAQAQFAGVLEACRERGVDGLLNVPSVRAATYVALAMGYRKNVQTSESVLANLCHVPSAGAVAETLVTDDAQVREALDHVSLEKLAILDLPGFLAQLA